MMNPEGFGASPRTPHLYRLWESLCQAAELPQVDRWLKQRFKLETRFGSQDRRWYSEAVFTGLRWAVSVHAHLKGPELMLSASPKDCWKAIQNIPAQDFFEALDRLRQNPAPAKNLGWAEQCLAQGLPAYYAKALVELPWNDDQKLRFLENQKLRVPLWLRLNHPAKRAAVESELVSKAVEHLWFKDALTLKNERLLQELEAFQKGWLEIQDLGSQLVGLALPIEGDINIWDACAGGGGKSLQLASRVGSLGKVYASDVRAYKLDEVKARARKAGFSQIKTLAWNGHDQPQLPADVSGRGGFDLILVDAPCSGSGTWRRSPDARFRVDDAELRDLSSLQASILDRVRPLLRPGGTLAYATCSWLPQENSACVQDFLKRHPDFQLLSEGLCGSPELDADTLYFALLKGR